MVRMVISHKTQGNAKIPAPKTVSLTAGVTASPHLFISTPNPLKYTDPDGKLIKATGDDGETYIWDNEKNQFYSGSGDNRNYDIKDEFIKTVQADLNKVEDSLNKAKDSTAISDYNTLADAKDYAVTIIRNKDNTNLFDFRDKSNPYIRYNPNNTTGGVNRDGDRWRPAFIGLGHELGHAKDHLILGHSIFSDMSEWNYPSPGFPSWGEQSAVEFENSIRRGYNPNKNFQRSRYFL